jgi:A/G-specific adenine glycosylase
MSAPEEQQIARFHRNLQSWYQQHGRHDLPWRCVDDPYAIWVSEVMLQQTQVKTVLERYYFPFLERFPTVEQLANADLQEVLKCWEGLGYYRRARHMHAAAQQLAGQPWPQEVRALQALPGIGRNTAHALAAFAFKKPYAVMEANVKRVVARIFALTTPKDAELWAAAQSLVNRADPFNYNQAMMDLGARICTPRKPDCEHCPAAFFCAGQGNPAAYPQAAKRKALPVRSCHIVLFQSPQARYYITPREEEFLHGMWQFPQVDSAQEHILFANQLHAIRAMRKLGDVQHDYSHFRLKAGIFLQPLPFETEEPAYWKAKDAIAAAPLSRTEKKILSFL